MIPKIIHQFDSDFTFDKNFEIIQKKLLILHPNYNYKLWSNLDINNLIKTNYSIKLLEKYKKCKNHCIKLFLAKCCIINAHGGICIDNKLLIIKNLNNIITNQKFIISNYFDKINYDFFIASESNNNLLNNIINSITNSDINLVKLENYFIDKKINFSILEKSILTPLSKQNLLFLLNSCFKKQKKNLILKKCKFSNGIYLFDNIWYKKQLINSLLIKNINNTIEKMDLLNEKKISCICVINKLNNVKKIINSFKSQNYTNKELLLIINNSKNDYNVKIKKEDINIKIFDIVKLKEINNQLYDINKFNPDKNIKCKLNLDFYRKYKDLSNLPDWKLKYHWESHGKNENRLNSLEMFNLIYPSIDLVKYKRIQKRNNNILNSKDDYAILYHHTFFDKYNKNDIYKFDNDDSYEILLKSLSGLNLDTDFITFFNENDEYNMNYLYYNICNLQKNSKKECLIYTSTCKQNLNINHFMGYLYGFTIKYIKLIDILNNEQNEWDEWIKTKFKRNQSNIKNIFYLIHRYRLLKNNRKIIFLNENKYIIHNHN